MATVADVLAGKSGEVQTISPTATVLEATQLMNRHKIGSLVVTRAAEEGERVCDRVVGMFTERDVLTRLVVKQRDPAMTLVEEIMTTVVAYCRPETSVEDVSAMMRERRIRHLPVCDGSEELKGMVSIGDLNAWHARGKDVEIMYLHEYIHGRV
jgi:CBS domain-containing protein